MHSIQRRVVLAGLLAAPALGLIAGLPKGKLGLGAVNVEEEGGMTGGAPTCCISPRNSPPRSI